MAEQDNRAVLISETRQRFEKEYIPAKSDAYDSRDVERLQQDDSCVDNYLIWQHDSVDETLKMIDESFQWRKEYAVHDLTESSLPKWVFEVGTLYLHGYDKEGHKIFWFRVKLHTKDAKTQHEKKKLVAFWLERYAKREHGKPLTVVFDMAETGLSNMDLDFVRYIIGCFKVYYPNYLSKIVIFELPWIMNAAFKLVKSWLGPDAVGFLKTVNKNDIQEYISAEYLPPHMGGTDTFKYRYPPLVDDDFQTPLCENGPITSEDETESKEEIDVDNKENPDSNEEQGSSSKKTNLTDQIPKPEDSDKVDSKAKNAKKALTTFKGLLLHIRLAPWYMQELQLRRLERQWWCVHDGATRASYRPFMRSCEMAVKATKREYNAVTIESASSHPAQLFRTIRSVTTLPQDRPNAKELEIGCEAFASYFADKVLLFRHDLPATVETGRELEAPCMSSCHVLDYFSPLSLEEVNKLLSSVCPTTCSLDPCLSWLIKAGCDGLRGTLREIINKSLSEWLFPGVLKEAVARSLLKNHL